MCATKAHSISSYKEGGILTHLHANPASSPYPTLQLMLSPAANTPYTHLTHTHLTHTPCTHTHTHTHTHTLTHTHTQVHGSPLDHSLVHGFDRTSYNGHDPRALPGKDVGDVHGVCVRV